MRLLLTGARPIVFARTSAKSLRERERLESGIAQVEVEALVEGRRQPPHGLFGLPRAGQGLGQAIHHAAVAGSLGHEPADAVDLLRGSGRRVRRGEGGGQEGDEGEDAGHGPL